MRTSSSTAATTPASSNSTPAPPGSSAATPSSTPASSGAPAAPAWRTSSTPPASAAVSEGVENPSRRHSLRREGPLMKRFVIAAALLLAALPVLAQEAPEDEEPSPEPILAHVSTAARLHTSPGGPAKGVVKSGEEVDVVGTTNGWMRVRETDKTTGWVDRRMLKPEDAEVDLSPKKFVRKASTKKAACAQDLEHCTIVGCATGEDEKSKNHALMNTLKHGPG